MKTNTESKKHKWLQPMPFSDEFRKSIAASKALLDNGFNYIGNYETNPDIFTQSDRSKPDLQVEGWDLYQDGDYRVIAIFEDLTIAKDFNEEMGSILTVHQVEFIIKNAIRIYLKKLPTD